MHQPFGAYGGSDIINKVEDNDNSWAHSIAQKNQQQLLDNLKMQLDKGEFDIADHHLRQLTDDSLEDWKAQIKNPRPSLQIFISRSMPVEVIRSYAKEAALYDGVLVMRGLPDNSFMSLSQFYADVIDGNIEEEFAGMQIDDESFELYDIKSVPAIILSKNNGIFDKEDDGRYDKIMGNIKIDYALELMAKEGEMRNEAKEILKK